jgi:hypothetical protein
VRGGDTSLFSLPSESMDRTPHTSNVSITTTITSAVTPTKNRPQRDGLRLHRTLEVISTLFYRLSAACSQLSQLSATSTDSSVEATEEIRQTYIQLVFIHAADLKALIDVFQLDLPPLQISRMVSEDREDIDCHRHATSLPLPPQLVRSNSPDLHETYKLSLQNRLIPCEESREWIRLEDDDDDGDDDERRDNLFSPSTADMNSIEHQVDDLRRTIGSFDMEDVEGEREGPPAFEARNHVERKQGRLRRRWRRPHFRRAVLTPE